MNEDDAASRRENEIRLSGESTVVQTVSVASAMQEPADRHFRPRVPRPDAGHVAAALFGGDAIHP
jgi:hypothetical protein